MGGALLSMFRRLLHPLQVGDLADGGPKPTLRRFAKCPRLRVLCCGGDGTAAWVMSAIDELHMACSPAIAVMPLGTGAFVVCFWRKGRLWVLCTAVSWRWPQRGGCSWFRLGVVLGAHILALCVLLRALCVSVCLPL